jgi:hypothetical protein
MASLWPVGFSSTRSRSRATGKVAVAFFDGAAGTARVEGPADAGSALMSYGKRGEGVPEMTDRAAVRMMLRRVRRKKRVADRIRDPWSI